MSDATWPFIHNQRAPHQHQSATLQL